MRGSSGIRRRDWRRGLVFGVLAAIGVGAAPPATAEESPWDRDQQWLSLRFGYARSNVPAAAAGNVGYGIAYTRFVLPKLAVSGHIHHELLGRYSAASDVAVPFGVEVSRHFAWRTEARPFLGVGGAAVYRKTYRTGQDTAGFVPAVLVTAGVHARLDDRNLLGVGGRMVIMDGTRRSDPVFPIAENSATSWSLKLTYSRVF